jgi:hypothetical protein
MTQTTLITLNAILDLAVVLAVVALVRLTHRIDRHDRRGETLHPMQPIPLHMALPADEAGELSRAA